MRVISLSIILLSLALDALAGTSFEWRQGATLPSARDNLGFGVVDDMLVLAGGAYWKNEQKHYSRDTIAYSPRTGKWVRLPFLPRPGAYGAAGIVNGQLVIAGGANENTVLATSIRLVKKNGSYQWDRLPDLPHPVSGARGAVIGSKFLVISGSWGAGEAGIRMASPTLLELDMANPKAWKESALPEGFRARTGSAAAVIGDRLFIFGGHGVHEDGVVRNFGDAWVMQGRTWKHLADLPVASRWSVALPLDGTHIALFGGYSETPVQGFMADTLIYDTKANTYTKSTPLPLPVCNQAAGIIGNTIYLAGGEDLQRHRTSALFTSNFGGK